MTQATAGFATILKIGNGATSETFDEIAEVLDIEGPSLTSSSIEVTSHSSGGWREYIGGLKDGGEISFSLNLVPNETTQWTDTHGLLGLYTSGATNNFQIIFPDSTQGDFAATVTDFGLKAPMDGQNKADVKMKISGEIQWS